MTTYNTTITARAAAIVASFCLVATAFVPSAMAQTSSADLASLLARINELQAQLAALTGSGSSTSFTRDLTLGSTGSDVTALQNLLIGKGFGIPAGATGYFGAQTRSALAAYQSANGIAPAAGYFGAITRARIGASVTPQPNPGTPGSPAKDLQGGAGSIDRARFVSGLNNEEVGEDQEDVEVAGLEVRASRGSDIEITAVTLNFDQGTASEDFEDYASEVSIWLDGEELARVDADEFEDDDFEQTISLDRGAIIRRGDTGELVVAVSGNRTIDSEDLGDDWTVEFSSVRFRDAQNATVTNATTGDIGGATRSFSFESFATAAGAGLRISKGDDEINDSRAVSVDDSSITKDEQIFSFKAEAEGDSDLLIDEMTIDFDFTGTATALDDVFSRLCLEMDGDRVSCENAPNDDSIAFDSLDIDLDAGDEAEFVVVADVRKLDDGSYAEGDTVTARITSSERDLWDVEDETGEELSTSDMRGSASSEAISFFQSGILVKAVSTDTDSNDGQTSGTFRIVVDVTAFGDDQFIYRGADNASSSSSGLLYTVYRNGAATSTDMALSDLVSSNATLVGGDYYRVDEGRTKRFTLTVTVDPDAAGLYSVELDAIRFDPDQSADDSAEDDTTYSIPSSENVETGAEYLAA